MHRLRRDVLGALMLLTRLPVRMRTGDAGDPAQAVWAYPLVGLLVGGLGALADWLARWIGMPPLLAAVWTFGLTALLTGALHEDGLADTADGFGAGGDAARILAIMRDSRIGTYGALALIVTFFARTAALAATTHPTGALLAAAATGRAAMIVPLLTLAPARPDGLGAMLRGTRWPECTAGFAVAAAVDWLLLPEPMVLPVILAAACAVLALGHLARKRIGGFTGDVLGAAEQIAEVITLCLAAAA